jgi:hypothetical protein
VRDPDENESCWYLGENGLECCAGGGGGGGDGIDGADAGTVSECGCDRGSGEGGGDGIAVCATDMAAASGEPEAIPTASDGAVLASEGSFRVISSKSGFIR